MTEKVIKKKKIEKEPTNHKGKLSYQKRLLEEEEQRQLIADYIFLMKDIGEEQKDNDS